MITLQNDQDRLYRELNQLLPITDNLLAPLTALDYTTNALNDKLRAISDSPVRYRTSYLASLFALPTSWVRLVSTLDKLRAYERPDIFFAFDVIFYAGQTDPLFDHVRESGQMTDDIRTRIPGPFSLLIAAGYLTYFGAVRDLSDPTSAPDPTTNTYMSANKRDHIARVLHTADSLMQSIRGMWPLSTMTTVSSLLRTIVHYEHLAVDPETLQDNGGVAITYEDRVLKALLVYVSIKKNIAPLAVSDQERVVLEHASVPVEAVHGMMVPLDPAAQLTNNSHVELTDNYNTYGSFATPIGAVVPFNPFNGPRGTYALPKGNLFLCVAPSGHGKSYMMCEHAANVLVNEAVSAPSLYFTYELSASLVQSRIIGCHLNGWMRRLINERLHYGKCQADNEMATYVDAHADELANFIYVTQRDIVERLDLRAYLVERSAVTAGFVDAFNEHRNRNNAERKRIVRTIDANRMSLQDVDGYVRLMQDTYGTLSTVYLDWLGLIPQGRGFKGGKAKESSWERVEALTYDIVDYAKMSWQTVAMTATQGSRAALTEMSLGMEGTAYGLYTWNAVSLGASVVLPYTCNARRVGIYRTNDPFSVRIGFATIPKSRLYDTPYSNFVLVCDYVHGIIQAHPYSNGDLDAAATVESKRSSSPGKSKMKVMEALAKRVLFGSSDARGGVKGDYDIDFDGTGTTVSQWMEHELDDIDPEEFTSARTYSGYSRKATYGSSTGVPSFDASAPKERKPRKRDRSGGGKDDPICG